jgi:hypothetical protein
VNGEYDREEALQLIHRHLEQTLSEAELLKLEALLVRHEGVRRDLVLASALHQELITLHDLPALDQAGVTSDPEPVPVESPLKRLVAGRTSRRLSREVRGVPWTPALAAAMILIALALLVVVLGTGERGSSKTQRDWARGGKDEALHLRSEHLPHEGAPGDADREKALEEKIRADGLRRLADLDLRRRKLMQAPPPETPDPQDLEHRKKDELGLLEAEKRQIEEEMKEAIARAAKSYRERTPAPATDAVGKIPSDQTGPVTSASFAQVERLEGAGYLLRKEGRTPLREGQEILFGDGLETVGENSRIVFKFVADKTRLDLRGESVIREVSEGEKGPPGPPGPGKRFMLARGMLTAEVAKQPANQPLVIKSPHAEAVVLGTVLRMTVDPVDKGATRLEVVEGRVRFTRSSDRKVLEVSAGHAAVAAASSPFISRPVPPLRAGTSEKPALVSVTLVSADTGRPILQHDPLEDGMVLTLADLPTRNLNIQVLTSPPTVGCVVLSWDGVIKIEGRAPYFLEGNTPEGKPLAWTPAPGDHTLVVTPYSGPAAANRREGTGSAGSAMTIRLRVR